MKVVIKRVYAIFIIDSITVNSFRGSFVRAGRLCVLFCIWAGGEVGALLGRFGPSSGMFYWLFRGGASFVNLFVFFMSCVCCAFVRVCLCVPCGLLLGGGGGEGAGLLALVCGVWLWVRHFPIGILGQVWYLIVLILDLCTLTYFKFNLKI